MLKLIWFKQGTKQILVAQINCPVRYTEFVVTVGTLLFICYVGQNDCVCQLAVSAKLAYVVQVCLPKCRMSVDPENIFLWLASVVLKAVYMEMIPQLLLV